MVKRDLTRRSFIKGSVGIGIAFSSTGLLSCSLIGSGYNSHGLPRAVLGKTGVKVPKIALGLGSRFCNIAEEHEALAMLEYALDNGLYYWDTAHIYENKKNGVISEERIGKIVKTRRNEIFLSTKVTSRDPDEAMKQIEISLKRLQTDHLDMLMIHDVKNMEDNAVLFQKGNLVEIVSRLKEQKVTRFIGFSGHAGADALKNMLDQADFDSMLVALNTWGSRNNPQPRQEMVIPAALDKGMGVILMKIVRPRENNPEFKGDDLVRFALSLEGPTGIVVGMESIEIVKKNLDILRKFTPMSFIEKKQFVTDLNPFFNHENLEWMKPGYKDGYWG
jgi:hypothetical protein